MYSIGWGAEGDFSEASKDSFRPKTQIHGVLSVANPVLDREGYILAYDGRTKNALWIYEELTKNSVTGKLRREKFRFVADPDLPEVIRAHLLSYKNTGFDRGHLTLAADNRFSYEAMYDRVPCESWTRYYNPKIRRNI